MKQTHIRRTEITIETRSLTIIRSRNVKSGCVRCQNCQTLTAAFTPAHAVLIFRVDAAEIKRLFQINQIHFADDSALCGKSLADYFKQEIRYVED
ncbi:MAG: hypothetical protein LH614_03815 [Pyrinomonadaceae bacterium]|nr:hypothetical protein [Pyrinomonadaceae bacterium]